MMRMTRLVCLGIFLLTAVGCAYPDAKVTRSEDRPALIIEGAPPTATLVVDGINHGEARQYNGDPKTLLVESGMHKVQILDRGNELLSREVYLSDGETRSLTLKRE